AEAGSAAFALAFHPDPAPMLFHDAPTDVEPQPGAWFRDLHRVMDLAEGLEQAGDVLGVDAAARVAHAHLDLLVTLHGLDDDGAPAGRELVRVVEEVEQDLGHPARIRLRPQVLRHPVLQPYAGAFAQLVEGGRDLGHKIRHVRGLLAQLQMPALESSHLQYLLDEVAQAVHVAVDDVQRASLAFGAALQGRRAQQVQLELEGGQGRVEFVRGRVEEVRLELVHLLQPLDLHQAFHGHAGGLLGAFALGQVAHRNDLRHAGMEWHGLAHDLHGHARAVRAYALRLHG